MSKENRFEELDRLGEEWYLASQNGDTAVVKAVNVKIFNELYNINLGKNCPNQEEIWGEFFLRKMKLFNLNYKGEKRKFSAYVKWCVGRLSVDLLKKNTGYKEKERNEVKSIDAVEEDGAVFSDPNSGEMSGAIAEQESFYDLLSLIMQIPERLSGRANNEKRRMYFRLFTTEYITRAVKDTCNSFVVSHERDVFASMNLLFLDFYMWQKCRTLSDLVYGKLKLYGEVVEGQKMEEIKFPLSNDIYIVYLKEYESCKVGDSAISNQHNAYKELLLNLCKQA